MIAASSYAASIVFAFVSMFSQLHVYRLPAQTASSTRPLAFPSFSFTTNVLPQSLPAKMSGLEVAGLVLAVMPLFISAFEHYEEELRGFKRFFRYEQEVCRCRSRLLVQYATLSQTLEYLLTELTDKDELDGMITRGYGRLWEDSDMSDKLQQQLGTAYESFCIVLAQIFDDMEQLATVLDIERKERV